MKTERFSKKPTPRQVIEALSEIGDATDFEKLSAEEEGLTIEAYEKKHGRRETTRLTSFFSSGDKPKKEKETKDTSHIEREYDIADWISRNVPKEFRESSEILRILKKILLLEEFQDIWNYKISIPEGLTKERLIQYLSWKIKTLENFSEIDLNSKEIPSLENILDVMSEIRKKIIFLEDTNMIPSKDMYSKQIFSKELFFYLRRKLVVKKLEEIIALLDKPL